MLSLFRLFEYVYRNTGTTRQRQGCASFMYNIQHKCSIQWWIHGSNNNNMHDSHNPIKACLLFYIEIIHDKNMLVCMNMQRRDFLT